MKLLKIHIVYLIEFFSGLGLISSIERCFWWQSTKRPDEQDFICSSAGTVLDTPPGGLRSLPTQLYLSPISWAAMSFSPDKK